MARQKLLFFLIAVTGLVLVIALVGRSTQGGYEIYSFEAAQLKNKTLWTQVNPEPYRISVAADALCRAPTAKDYQSERKSNPHAAAYITVYVNNIGREAMLAKEVQRFPQGSIIVKEKIGSAHEGGKPLLYTLMRKREPGYNPKVGDWEFSVVGADGSQLLAMGKLENCEGCHRGKSDSDYIFRPYFQAK